ncbi:flagellar biosynthesis protein FliQ [Virgibacillus sp. MSP4-1]|uniref:flagellar biosynthesis protein FliQ n=1 Tax=Virgibacillus sp. MSP4-1 TaxID=2700081 RepID=UPI0003A5DAE4|nr:flagellar biosynthesis protein FliQ [Virgibacillus sp. MSP4-1]QHS22261.1 flagellar biosynthesis protein FliQ [Virgibacillus sp. MSP4-1]
MNSEFVISLAETAVYTLLTVIGPILILALVVGLLVSIFQATTQIQEQTLAFIPKIIAVFIGIIFFGPWMLVQVVDFTANIFNNLHQVIS